MGAVGTGRFRTSDQPSTETHVTTLWLDRVSGYKVWLTPNAFHFRTQTHD